MIDMECKYCHSSKVVKNGIRFGIQRYLCKNCLHKFYDNEISLPRMRVNPHTIVSALDMFYGGLSMRKTAEMLDNIFGEQVSQSTIHYWVHKYAELVKDFVDTLKPSLSGKYHHDETEIKVGGDGKYFWETIDEDTRFIVANLLTESRTSEDARTVFKMALQKQRPTAVFTDGSFSYDDAIKVFYSRYKVDRVEWVRRVGIRARETNNIVERLHGTLKDRTYPMRGLKNMKRSKTLLNGYVINYNYCRKHQSIKKTPAQAAGIEVKGWKQLIERATMSRTQQEIEARQIEVQVSTK
jgi:putative transposase